MKAKHGNISVAVTGMGVLNSVSLNVDEFGRALRAGRSGLGFQNKDRGGSAPANIRAELPDFSPSYQEILQRHSPARELMDKAITCSHRASRTIQASIAVAMEAWHMADLSGAEVPPEQIGLAVAGHNLTLQEQYDLYPKYRDDPEYVSPRYALHFMDTNQVGILSEIFNIRGEGFTVGGASASGSLGIIKAHQLIQLGIVDVCLVVGPVTDLSPMELQSLNNLGALGGRKFREQPEKACRPFDGQAEGFIYGQGAGCLVLESQASATRRGAEILASVTGGALLLDANRLSDPSEAGEVAVMQTALKRAGIDAREVDYLNTHGTSTPLGDATEIKAVRQVFDGHLSRLWLNSTKGFIGHCLFSAGVIEAIAVIIQMREGFIHPNANLEDPIDSSCRFSRAESEAAEIHIAMSNSFGFGGINTSVILDRGE